MRHKLVSRVNGEALACGLTQAQFETLRTAKASIVLALSVEEVFDIVIQNYAEFEKEALSITAHDMIFTPWRYDHYQDARRLLNRRLMNIMTVARSYLEKVKDSIVGIGTPSTRHEQALLDAIRTEYDTKIGYRVLEALRNYAQHQALPIHLIGFGMKTADGMEDTEFSISISLDCTKLRSDGGFKRTILTELEAIGQKNDLRPLLRKYISGVNQIQKKFRELTQTVVDRAEALITGQLRQFSETYSLGDRKVGADLIEIRDDGTVAEREHLFADFMEYRRQLAGWNCGFTRLEHRYVTSRVTSQEPRHRGAVDPRSGNKPP